MTSDLSILVTVHERQITLRRLLPHLKGFGCEILVTDSSKTRVPQNMLDEFNVRYLHHPGVDFYTNNITGLKELSSKYVVALSDDDFLVKKSVFKCLDFLRKNPDYVSAEGLSLKFQEKNATLMDSYGIEAYCLRQERLEASDFLGRAKQCFDVFWPPIHSVINRKCYLEVFEFIRNHPEYQPIRYVDKIVALFMALYGKTKLINTLYLLRSEDRQIEKDGFFNDLKKEVPFNELLNDLSKQDSSMIQYFAEQTGEEYTSIQHSILEILESYTKNYGPTIKARRDFLDQRNWLNRLTKQQTRRAAIFTKIVSESAKEVDEILKLIKLNPIKD